jgi:hypothetical protein
LTLFCNPEPSQLPDTWIDSIGASASCACNATGAVIKAIAAASAVGLKGTAGRAKLDISKRNECF